MPMINVAFLLLIFFLMSAAIVPPAPVDIEAPSVDVSGEVNGIRIFVGPDGVLIGEDGKPVSNPGDLAGRPIALSADSSLAAVAFVRIVETLRAAGVSEIHLVARDLSE